MKLLQMLLRGSPCCPQPVLSPPGRPRLECQTGVLPVLRESCGWSVGTKEGGGCQQGWGRGWEEEGTSRERGGLALP